MPWEMPSQNNSFFQPLVEAAMYVYNNWTNGGKKTAQQISKVIQPHRKKEKKKEEQVGQNKT